MSSHKKPVADRQRSDHARSPDKATSSSDAFAAQESGASGGPVPTSEELAGRQAGEEAGEAARRQAKADNASQHQVQGSADADADHELEDQSQGADKRMD